MAVTTDIEALLPHRKPFLFVDFIESFDDNGCVCTRTFFSGFFRSESFFCTIFIPLCLLSR